MNRARILLYLLGALPLIGGELPGAWSGDYAPCERHGDVLKQERLTLGVRFSIADPRLDAAFSRALDFWATVLEMEWHREDGRNCSIQVLSGNAGLFAQGEVARAQFPDVPEFQGWIAFNPGVAMPEEDLYLTAVHELGHVFGLQHNSKARSVMFFLQVDGTHVLDSADLVALAARHRLRDRPGDRVVVVPQAGRR